MRSARAVLLAVVASAVLVGFASPCLACSCVQQSDEQHYAQADVVFTGIAKERHDPNADGAYQGSGDVIHWTFDLQSMQKGKATDPQIVSSSRDEASCGWSFTIGHRYQVFASSENGELSTNICQGTRELSASQGPYTPPPPKSAPPGTPSAAPTLQPTPAPTPTPTAMPSPAPVVTATPTPTADITPTSGGRSSTAAVIATVLALAALAMAIGLTFQRSRSS